MVSHAAAAVHSSKHCVAVAHSTSLESADRVPLDGRSPNAVRQPRSPSLQLMLAVTDAAKHQRQPPICSADTSHTVLHCAQPCALRSPCPRAAWFDAAAAGQQAKATDGDDSATNSPALRSN